MAEPTYEQRQGVEKCLEVAPWMGLIDYDRTLADIDAHVRRFRATLGTLGVEIAMIDDMLERQRALEATSQTVSLLGFVRELAKQRGESLLADFKEAYVAITGYPVNFSDSEAFLKRVQRAGPYMIGTWGPDEDWQKLKLWASGYQDLPYRILTDQRKAHVIAQSQDGSGNFVFQPENQQDAIIAEQTWLIDDKPTAFAGGYAGRGFLLRRPGRAILNQRGDVPDNIVVIGSLDQLQFNSQGMPYAA